ncbi:arginine-ornithine antiporter [Fructilactobacillus lindneri]|uniref:Arginine ornithine antiporter n=2 Tax=Fructilactobacillus lindneri TaxID=53444 RepID=A0A0R2JTS7_9LACO|nr:basic amino acid/polyamine antiporter [Fructilactobacillus lindneri]ANZ57786.1 arginine-ornithine antiporter [Fructilactobacillus lindneri]ANZ59055.1 arginine-ornithine antiporter [Fructilactobacillus lindneri]KRN78773.1 arginine ornithine antiporter [Fructilactobacillus lindneri DSM 20690 = JCM 11027]POG98108.1 arginine-ornithine antiporter [Fructilactobacillus lindneri]POH01777.1 arginine-ornithine antiporter [Fructilactobacillus lindneri]
MNNNKGVSLLGLTMLVISASIGAGIYNASEQLAAVSTPGPALLSWLITGIGIFGLALSLKSLSETNPDLNGMAEYAQAGFGNFVGFISGWGYWLSSWVGSVAFATMMMSAVGYFLPAFRSGNSIPAIVVASIISWLLTFLVINGVENAAFINVFITVIKLIPLAAFVLLGIVMFKAHVFTAHFWQNFTTNFTYTKATPKGIFDQIKGCLITMMWVFVGIEGATMMAGRARKRSDASRATIISFISLLIINVVISMLPYGYLDQAQLAHVSNPALTYVVEDMIGPIGGTLVSISLIITIFGSWLSWTMPPVIATSQMAEKGMLPHWFGHLNHKNSPSHSLFLTQILLQLFLISLAFSDQAYNFAISLCTAAMVICYSLVAAYQIKVGHHHHSFKMMLPGIIALVFEVVGITFAGLQYLWLCSIAYVLGFVFYIKAAKENQRPINKKEWLLMILVTVIAIMAVVELALGKISLS